MDELPYRAIVDLETALFGQLGHQAPQREVASRPFQKPVAMLAAQSLRLVTTDLARGNATRLARTTNPFDRRTRRNTKMGRRRVARHPVPLNRRNHPLAQVHRIRLRHQMPASLTSQH